MDYALLPSTLSSLHLPPSSPFSARPPAPPLLEVCSPSPSPVMSCCDVVAPPPASDHHAPSRPVDLSASPRLHPPSAPPDTLGLSTPPGSLVPPAPPWSVVTTTSATDLWIFLYAPFLHPYGCSGLLFPFGYASALGHTGIASALLLRLICSSPRNRLGLLADVSLYSTLAPSVPQLRRGLSSLGLCHRTSTIIAAGVSSSVCHHSSAACYYNPFATSRVPPFLSCLCFPPLICFHGHLSQLFII
ncbi:hypothetical protein PO909_026938 [Leuciscus waleckii]